ncbi:aromatic/alkene/methane monooxygenase hydroxylase/oxygenase subunit alpha [Thauera sp. 63]|uniref:aromatic/alkene/methane monooxygenase hydroxylase/oxygenase subunit alpha n=1 Tax=Thauera sp. 63 TaxID=497321 RepID=UPI0002CE3AEB|nr:aromatic/alkene/methane monooxygenase hydroxylase/oxygenase subunit alpha [Thauera sp. 63]ENO79116.1 phenol hydroxylase P3 protein PoxD [Thauera sp. 63]
MDMRKKVGLRDRYRLMTRGLGWEPTYQPMDKVYPYYQFEGIKIHDWEAWEDPFRLTMDAYWKYQAEKERKLYAIIDAFSQHNGHLNISDARYVNALKLFLQGITPSEYNAARGFNHLGRQLPGVGQRVAAQMQAIDEIRHAQTQIHTVSHYNRFFNGFHNTQKMYDRAWYLSVPKSYFEDALTAGPFEFLTAISFSFEYVLTNLIFMPFMSGAAYNGDMATVTFGFSAQSDEARHMTLGLEVIKFMAEQDPANVPIIQKWIDKWFWRGYRLLVLVALMMDYMLPKRVMSWSEAWEMYFERAGGALFEDLERYGFRMPKYADVSLKEKDRYSHEAWSALYGYGAATGLHSWMPSESEMAWLSEKYPESFDRLYRPRFEFWRERQQQGKRFYNQSLPMLCQVCQVPTWFTEPDDPTEICYRSTEYKGNRYHFCSDGCCDIFKDEPEKYVQAWLPTHQVFQGNCGGASIPEVLDWYGVINGRDNLDYEGSEDQRNWEKWKSADGQAA